MSFENEVIQAEFRTVSSSKTLKEIESISNAILKLKRETEGLEKQKKEAAVQYGSNSKQVKELTAQIKANNAQLALHKSKLEDAQKKLKVTEMSSKQLKDRLAELKRAMDAVNKEAFPDRWNKLNTAYKETSAQLNKVTNGSNAVKKGVGSIMSYAKGLLPAFGFSAVIGGVMSLSKELFQLAMQMKSDNIRNTTIFGESLSYVEKEASRLSKTMGLTNREFVSNAASSADLLKPLGFTSEQAAKLSVRMQELAGPLAEWSKGKYNAAQITEVMNGAMTGEMERLKGLGIIIQQSAPEYQNMVKLKQKEEKCSLDQAKALATLELMYQKSADAQTAFAAGGNTLFRNWENLKATWRQAKEWMVELFSDSVIDGLEKQRNYVNALAVQLTNTNTSTAERVKILNQLKSINPDIVEGLSAENLEMGKLRENLDKYNGSMLERITLEKMNKDVEKKGNKFAEANTKLGEIGQGLYNHMLKVNPDIAQQKISLEEKIEKINNWRDNLSVMERLRNDHHGDPIMLDQYYRKYKNQKKKVEKLLTEFNESQRDMEIKKEMMIFPTPEPPINETPKSLLAIQQDKLTDAQKARDAATDNESLTHWNKEIEAINTEISRLQALGTSKSEEQVNERKKLEDERKKREEEQKKRENEQKAQAEAQKKFQEEILNSSLTAIEKEEKAYAEKQKLAGNNAKVQEILLKQHNDNLAKINADAVRKHLNDKQQEQSIELQNVRIRHNEELAEIKTLAQAKTVLAETLSAQELEKITTLGEAKKAIKAKQAKEENDIAISHAKDLLKELEKIMSDTKPEGLNLADDLLSDEQKEELENKIRDLKEKISEMLATGNEDQPAADVPKAEKSKVDILGMTPEDWENLFKNLDEGKISLQDVQDISNAIMDAWGMYDQLMSANEKKQLKNYEKNTKEKKNLLSQQLDQGIISQEQYNARTAQLDAELEAKQSEIEAKQAKRKKTMAISQAMINTALGVTSVLKEPFPLNFILAALIGSMGAAQVATIMAQPDGFKAGGFTSSAASDDEEAGIVHANEFVATADAVRNPTVLPVLRMIDKAQREGTVRTLDLSALGRTSPIGGNTVSTSVSDNPGFTTTNTAADPEMKELLRRNIEMMQILADKRIEIPWYGKGGIDEKMKKATKYEQQITSTR